MTFEGFTPYDPRAAEWYGNKRWWLGLTLGDMFDKACDLYPQREALVGAGKRYTWARLREQVDRMAYNLVREGFVKGDTVLLQLPQLAGICRCLFCTAKSRAGDGSIDGESYGP